MLEIERKRHKGISLQLALLMQPPDLTFVCQQAPDAHRILIEHVSVVVGTDMHSLYQQFTILNIDPAVLQVDPSGTQALDLRTFQFNAGFQRFQNEVFMARFTVCGNGFCCRTLLSGCHSARLLSPLWFVVSVYHFFMVLQGLFLKKL
jgi:hypothetical protein